MVNEEILDLLSRKNRSVDLAFQHLQEPLIHGLSSLTILANRLFKEIQSAQTVDAQETLTGSLLWNGERSSNLMLTHLTLNCVRKKSSRQPSCLAMIYPNTLKKCPKCNESGNRCKKWPMDQPTSPKPQVSKTNGLNLTNDHKTIALMLSSAVPFLGHGRASTQTKASTQKNSHKTQ